MDNIHLPLHHFTGSTQTYCLLSQSSATCPHSKIALQKANSLLFSKDNKDQIYSLFSCFCLLYPFALTLFLSVFTLPLVCQVPFLISYHYFSCRVLFSLHQYLSALSCLAPAVSGFQKAPFSLLFPDFVHSSGVPCVNAQPCNIS